MYIYLTPPRDIHPSNPNPTIPIVVDLLVILVIMITNKTTYFHQLQSCSHYPHNRETLCKGYFFLFEGSYTPFNIIIIIIDHCHVMIILSTIWPDTKQSCRAAVWTSLWRYIILKKINQSISSNWYLSTLKKINQYLKVWPLCLLGRLVCRSPVLLVVLLLTVVEVVLEVLSSLMNTGRL